MFMDVPAVWVVTVLLLSFATTAVGLRFHLRRHQKRGLGRDDWTALLALVSLASDVVAVPSMPLCCVYVGLRYLVEEFDADLGACVPVATHMGICCLRCLGFVRPKYIPAI